MILLLFNKILECKYWNVNNVLNSLQAISNLKVPQYRNVNDLSNN